MSDLRDQLQQDYETGELRSVWLSHTVLKDQWRQAAPKVGERVGICYIGLHEPEDGHPYHMYSVRVDRAEETPAGDGAPSQPHPSGDDRYPDEQLPY